MKLYDIKIQEGIIHVRFDNGGRWHRSSLIPRLPLDDQLSSIHGVSVEDKQTIKDFADKEWTQKVIDTYISEHPSIEEPDESVTYTPEELFDLFEAEYQDIYEASKTNKDVAFFFDKLRTRNRPIRADNPKLKQGLDLYVSLGLITQEKRDSIIS